MYVPAVINVGLTSQAKDIHEHRMAVVHRLTFKSIPRLLYQRKVFKTNSFKAGSCDALRSIVHSFSTQFMCHRSDNPLQAPHRKREILIAMTQLGINNPLLHQAVVDAPDVAPFSASRWEQILFTLISAGIKPDVAVNMVLMYPSLLSISPELVAENLNAWNNLVKDCYMCSDLLATWPWLISQDHREIQFIFGHIKAVVGSVTGAVKVLKRCPQIMLLGRENLLSVSDYVSEKMFVRNASEYYNSTVLGCTLSEVKTRHVFLDRCGRYKRSNPKQSELVPTGNPSLCQIYDSSSEDFATEIAGLTSEEFAVFRELFETEMEEAKEGDNSGDESDSDSD